MTVSILILLDFYQYVLVCTDTSGEGIGGVVMQEGRIVIYESIELELFAIVHSLKGWWHSLIGRKFKLQPQI